MPLDVARLATILDFSDDDGLRLVPEFRQQRFAELDVLTRWPAPKEIPDHGNTFASSAPKTLSEVDNPAIPGQSTAGGIKDCKAWLSQQLADPTTKRINRNEFEKLAKSKFPDRLSARGFRKVWTEVAQKYPSRKRPGPKPPINS